DKIRQHLRWQQIIRRRKYEVKWSNVLWHLDGHHKMIQWWFVIHIFIDGHCRTVCNFPSHYK
ncbi:hypothetical protein BD769DRAFT_1348343, partial [Suillus cothurnatus]